MYISPSRTLQDIVQFVSYVVILVIVRYAWVGGHHGVLCSDVTRVVDFPVHVSYFSRRMEQTLKASTVSQIRPTFMKIVFVVWNEQLCNPYKIQNAARSFRAQATQLDGKIRVRQSRGAWMGGGRGIPGLGA